MSHGDKASTASVETSDRDQVVVAVISGELDMVSADPVGTVLFDRVALRPKGLVVDLAVTFIGSAGLSMLLELYGRTQSEGIGFAIVADKSPALRGLTASGLDNVLPMAKSVDDAVDAIQEA